MASVRKRGNVLHIQWYDPIEDRITSKSTGMTATEINRKKAGKYAKELQGELSKRNKELKKIGIQKITISDAFDHFLRNNQNKHYKTIKDYNRFYNKFTEYFDPHEPCSNITKIRVEDWINQIKQLQQQQNSIHGYGKQCIHFLNFLFEYNYTQMFKINKEVKTRPEVKEKVIFPDEELLKIFNGLAKKNENFQVLIHLLFYTGLRSSDILKITCEKIDLCERSIKYYSPKRKKYREVAFHEDLALVLSSRINKKIVGNILEYNTVESLGRAVTRYLSDLGFPKKKYTARTFRKTFISLARSRYKMDASVVKELIGHEPGNTTDKFYNQITIETMRDELNKFKRPTSQDSPQK